MDRPVGKYINELIATARATFRDVQITRRDERPARALIDIEGRWAVYRIIVSEIILLDLERFIEWLRQNLPIGGGL